MHKAYMDDDMDGAPGEVPATKPCPAIVVNSDEQEACSLLLELATKDGKPEQPSSVPSSPASLRLPSINSLLSALPSPTSSSPQQQSPFPPHVQRHVIRHGKSYSVDSTTFFQNGPIPRNDTNRNDMPPPPQTSGFHPYHHVRSNSNLGPSAVSSPHHRRISSVDSNVSIVSSAPSTPYLVNQLPSADSSRNHYFSASSTSQAPQITYRYPPTPQQQQDQSRYISKLGAPFIEVLPPPPGRFNPSTGASHVSQYPPSPLNHSQHHQQHPNSVPHAVQRRIHHIRTSSAPSHLQDPFLQQQSQPSPYQQQQHHPSFQNHQQQPHQNQSFQHIQVTQPPPQALNQPHFSQRRQMPRGRMDQDPQLALFREEQRRYEEKKQAQQQQQQQQHEETETGGEGLPAASKSSPQNDSPEANGYNDDEYLEEEENGGTGSGLNVNGTSVKRRLRANREQLRVLEAVFAKTHQPSAAHKKELAAQLGMPHKSILYWFQNRRANLQRQKKGKGYVPVAVRMGSGDGGDEDNLNDYE